MPVYKEAPVSLELLKKHPERILAALPDAKVGKHCIIVPRGSERFIPPISGTEVIAAQTGGGFVYCNRSAVKNVSSGEKKPPGPRKPIPCPPPM
jgi:hypothetical protein